MVNQIEPKKNNGLLSIGLLLFKAMPEVALTLSSAFFISLLLIILIARDFVFNAQALFFVIAGVSLIYSFIVKRIKIFSNIFLILGSLVFFTFLISNYFLTNSLFSQAFIYYRKKVEYVLNLGVLSFFLYLFFFFLILYGLPIIFTFIKRKQIRGSGLKNFLLSALNFLTWIAALAFGIFILFGRHLPGVDDWTVKFLISLAKLLVPFLGFSLVYLHGNILIRKLVDLIYRNQSTTPTIEALVKK